MFDYLKLAMLTLLFIICSYSAWVKFSFTTISNAFSLSPDYHMCNNYDATRYEECHKLVDEAFAETKTKCASYIKKLDVCKSTIGNRCSVELNNVNACGGAVLKSKFDDAPKLWSVKLWETFFFSGSVDCKQLSCICWTSSSILKLRRYFWRQRRDDLACPTWTRFVCAWKLMLVWLNGAIFWGMINFRMIFLSTICVLVLM